MKFLKVEKSRAEEIRKRLSSQQAIDKDYYVQYDKGHVYFPLKKETDLNTIVEKEGQKKEERPTKFVDLLRNTLEKEELDLVKNSYDILGEVAIMEIPAELENKEKLIGKALLDFCPLLRAVFKKVSEVGGEHRTRDLKLIAGTGSTETTYKEHGCVYKFDVGTVFFTERLSTEREIVANQVQEGEIVFDMFAGAGPFSVLIAKKQPEVKKVYAIDVNPDAVHYMKENIKLNKVGGKVEAIEGDACELVDSRFSGIADRVIMNLPKTGKDYLPWAVKALNKKGVIHYYTFRENEEDVAKEIKDRLESIKIKSFHTQQIRKVKSYAPREWTFSADLFIEV